MTGAQRHRRGSQAGRPLALAMPPPRGLYLVTALTLFYNREDSMSRASREEQAKLDRVLGPHGQYDPNDPEQAEKLLNLFNVKISLSEDPRFPGWEVLWKHGGGLACPAMPKGRARLTIALSCYLDLCGVNVALTDSLAYWFFKGPLLAQEMAPKKETH